MKKQSHSLYLLLTVAVSSFVQPAHAFQIEFNYSYDTQGFFTDQTTGAPLLERRTRLEQAATFYSGFTDNLSAIQATNTNSWSVNIGHPSSLGSSVTLTDVNIAENTIQVFVGGSTSSAGVLGFAGTGYGLTSTGESAFQDSVFTRGQANTTGLNANDYGIWGGSIWFNDVHDWFFGEDEAGLTPGRPDFLTTATHELGHILGYGGADSWHAAINSDGFFEGETVIAVTGGLVAVGPFDSHWAEGVTSERNGVLQEAMMDPSTPYGQRQLPTNLDYAGFKDIGWEVAAVPLPSSLVFFVTGILSFVASAYKKRGV